ncbi:MAG: hypothetical protein GX876_05220, partial [Bacteroidales bacterium]|nr:hypothetical protein [Bacteroidales bacterium]
MRYSLFRISNTGADNNTAMFLQAMHAMLAGIFLSVFDITVHSLFLARFDETNMARAFIFSGIAGMVLAAICSESGKRIRSGIHAIIILLFVSLAGFLIWVLLIMIPGDRIIAVAFIAIWPLNGLVMLKFAGDAGVLTEQGPGRLQSKNIRTWIITGAMSGSFLVALLINTGMDARHFLLIGSVSILMATVMLIFTRITRGKYTGKITKSGDVTGDYRDSRSITGLFRENQLFRRISCYAILSVAATLFIRYSFMAETRLQYPSM